MVNPFPSPKGMVYVPAGPFIMGSNYGDADEAPEHAASTALSAARYHRQLQHRFALR